MKFYCVGYTAMRYYMNGYQMGNLEGHKAKTIAVDLIATFCRMMWWTVCIRLWNWRVCMWRI